MEREKNGWHQERVEGDRVPRRATTAVAAWVATGREGLIQAKEYTRRLD